MSANWMLMLSGDQVLPTDAPWGGGAMIRTDIYERIEHERRDAALVVCGHATDTDDARQLLTRLGLLVDGHLDWPEPGLLDVANIKNVAATGAGGAGFR